jgi:hypothetical protein
MNRRSRPEQDIRQIKKTRREAGIPLYQLSGNIYVDFRRIQPSRPRAPPNIQIAAGTGTTVPMTKT